MAESSKNGIFSFDEFKLDSARLMLYRGGSEVALPPKVVKTLAVLVESAGTIISKDEVIERVWDDSIVEESNLTQYLYVLRKTLGSMPDERPYIETLRRRGYRFNGQVERLREPAPSLAPVARERESNGTFSGVAREGNVLRLVDWKPAEAPAVPAIPAEEKTVAPVTSFSGLKIALAVGAALILVGGPLAYFVPRLMPAATTVESRRELSITRLTNGAIPGGATISPDGNYFVYHEPDGDTVRMFIQQTGQSSRIEILSTTDKLLLTKTFSPDGQFVYYAASDKGGVEWSLYRIPTMGGASTKILTGMNGVVSFSPDGKEFIFARTNKSTGETSLVIADKDGRTERVFLSRKSALGWSPAWSPDGKTIAVSERESGSRTQRIQLVSVPTGDVTSLSKENWDTAHRMVWTPDGAGIVMVGTREGDSYSTRRDQVYFISAKTGVSHRITTDGNRHDTESLGVTKSGAILAIPGNRSSQVWSLKADGDAASAVQITKGAADGRAGLTPLPDGRIAYLARAGEDLIVLVSNADGGGAKQLSSGFQHLEELRADPSGKYFVFSTLKDGKNQIFRIDAGGGNLKQLTSGEGRVIDSTISPDGRDIVYDTATYNNASQYSLQKIPSDGGKPVQLATTGCIVPTYSPDGSLISCVRAAQPEIVVLSASDGRELERHPLPSTATWNFGIGWTPDGSGLVYIQREKDTSNVWVQPRDGSKPRPLTNFTSGFMYRYAFSHDGTQLFVARGYPTQDVILIENFR